MSDATSYFTSRDKSADELDQFTLPPDQKEMLDRHGLPFGGGQTAEQIQFQEGALQWIRRINLTVFEGEKGTGLDLSQFRIDFRVTKQTAQSPNFLDCKVYNLAPATVKKVRQYKRVQLSAGYQSNFGMLFDGNVVLYITGKENPVDTYINIIAGDNDSNLNSAVSILSFPAGTDEKEQVTTAMTQAGYKIGEVNLGKEKGQPTLRSSHYLGSTSRFIRNHMNATDSDFFVDDGKAYAISRNGYRKGEIVKLSPTTGLTGFPSVTPSGIEAQCLLNPKLRLTGLVQIETSLLSGVPFVPGTNVGAAGEYGAGQSEQNPEEPFSSRPIKFNPTLGRTFEFASITPTGIYKIVQLSHHGDNRGNPWYSEMICAASGAKGEDLAVNNPGTAFTRAARNPRESPQPAAAAGGVPSLDPGHPAPTRRR